MSVELSPRLPEPVGPMSPVPPSSSSEGEDSGSDSGSESDSSSEAMPPAATAMTPAVASPVEEPAPAQKWNLQSFLPPVPPAPHSEKKQVQV